MILQVNETLRVLNFISQDEQSIIRIEVRCKPLTFFRTKFPVIEIYFD